MISVLATADAARAFIRQKCKEMQQDNGAQEAAEVLSALIGAGERTRASTTVR
jgi:hypothetical protein